MGFIIWKQYMNRGVLHLPLCVIYGFGALAIMAFLGKRRSLPVIFLYGVVISTVVELDASYVIGWATGRQLWDYSHWPLHFFQGRISLSSSMLLAFSACQKTSVFCKKPPFSAKLVAYHLIFGIFKIS